ncbi:MAG TPA: hypothetical protein VGJ32_09005 [Solirubrobacteraceae bacterium]
MRGVESVRALIDPPRARELLRAPMHRDALALVVNSATTAAAGLLYWIIAAKTYSAHVVGTNAALIASMMFLAGAASLDLPNILVRFLPGAGTRTGRYIARSYAASGLVGACIAAVFVFGASAWAPRLSFLGSAPALTAGFVLSTVGWSVFAIQDGVLTALGRAVWVPIENAVFSVLKVALLVALASALPVYGIFASWTVAMLLSVVAVNALVFTRLTRRPRAGPSARRPPARDFARYAAADYTAAVAWLASTNLLPVVVTAVAGATTTAYFALAWAVALPLYAVADSIGTSLVLHGSQQQQQLPALVRQAAWHGACLLVPAVALLVLLAPSILSLFGAAYAREAAAGLRLLALAALPNLVMTLAVSVARVDRRLGRVVVALWVKAAIVLGLAAPLVHALGPAGAGLGFLVSECVAAGGLVAYACAGPRQRARAADVRAMLGEAASGGWVRRARSGRLAARVLVSAPLAGAERWRRWPVRTDSDVVVFLAGPRHDAHVAVKIAWSAAGAHALTSQRRHLAVLRSAAGLNGFRSVLPDVVCEGAVDGRPYRVEAALPGVDGRRFARTAARERALAATARGMDVLYRATAAPRVVDDDLLASVLDERLDRIIRARGRTGPELVGLRAEVASALRGRRVLAGRVHGDLWLGNVLLAPDASALTGVVDWEASHALELPAVDVAHLVLSTRSASEGRPFGEVTRRVLLGDPLTPLEADLLAPYARAHDGLALRHLVLLTWLQHVAQRLAQSTLHPQRRWLRRNVDPVLSVVRL